MRFDVECNLSDRKSGNFKYDHNDRESEYASLCNNISFSKSRLLRHTGDIYCDSGKWWRKSNVPMVGEWHGRIAIRPYNGLPSC